MNAGKTYTHAPGRSRQRSTTTALLSESRIAAEETFLELIRVDSVRKFNSGVFKIPLHVDWEILFNLANQNQLAPLVYNTIKKTRLHSDSDIPIAKFYQEYQRTRSLNKNAYVQLIQILDRLRSAGIESIVLKGAAMAEPLYEDIGLRPFKDLDILVKQKDLDRVHQILVSAGYNLNYRGEAVPCPNNTDRKYRRARQYFHTRKDYLSIDPHWRITKYPFLPKIDYDKFWQQADRINIAGAPVVVLSPEDTLLYLCNDFVSAVWYGQPEVKVLRDIAELTFRSEVNWDKLVATGDDDAQRLPLYIGLTLAQDLLGAEIPGQVLQSLFPKPSRINSKLVGYLREHVVAHCHPLKYMLLVTLLHTTGLSGYAQKAKWLTQLIFVPPQLWSSVPHTLRRMF